MIIILLFLITTIITVSISLAKRMTLPICTKLDMIINFRVLPLLRMGTLPSRPRCLSIRIILPNQIFFLGGLNFFSWIGTNTNSWQRPLIMKTRRLALMLKVCSLFSFRLSSEKAIPVIEIISWKLLILSSHQKPPPSTLWSSFLEILLPSFIGWQLVNLWQIVARAAAPWVRPYLPPLSSLSVNLTLQNL